LAWWAVAAFGLEM